MDDNSVNETVTSLLGQTLKAPLAALISSMELLVRTLQQMQKLYDESVDHATQLLRQTLATKTTTSSSDGGKADSQIDLTRDTLNGLIAFVVPGPDPYSVAQGVSTVAPGGIDAGITDLLVKNLDFAQPSPPEGPAGSAAVAGLLNQIAAKVNPSASRGSFSSAFARLSFAEKVSVFKFIEGDPSMAAFRRLGGVLGYFVAFLTYSEAPAINPENGKLTRRPVGWDLSSYTGVADGRDEFKGYYQDRMSVATATQYRG